VFAEMVFDTTILAQAPKAMDIVSIAVLTKSGTTHNAQERGMLFVVVAVICAVEFQVERGRWSELRPWSCPNRIQRCGYILAGRFSETDSIERSA
jgi:hypothetical protein